MKSYEKLLVLAEPGKFTNVQILILNNNKYLSYKFYISCKRKLIINLNNKYPSSLNNLLKIQNKYFSKDYTL